jgi:aminoglycoside phosphotransferase (APT) family kinase protein
VPRVHALGTYEQRPALLMEWCAGRPLLDELRARPSQVFRLGLKFGRMHAAIHRIAAPAALRTNWIDWAGPLPPQLVARLERLSTGRTARLLHMDYHPLNVVVHRGRVSAVLDWTNVHGGDPRADFARTVTILRLSPPRSGGFEPLGRLLLEMGWRYGYGPLDSDMAAFYVWAGIAMQHDLAGRFSVGELAHVRRWTAAWQRRVLLTPDP